MKPYAQKGKIFVKKLDSLESYESISKKNNNPLNPSDGFWDCQNSGLIKYTPKKTQNKKDIIASHRRSGKKTERQFAKKYINKFFK